MEVYKDHRDNHSTCILTWSGGLFWRFFFQAVPMLSLSNCFTAAPQAL